MIRHVPRLDTSDSARSSSTLSLFPPSPKIFHGREVELAAVVSSLLQEPARVAILGPGGIGKSSLALAALHHQDVVDRFSENRHFVSCEAALSSNDLVSAIATYLGLNESRNRAKAILKHFSALTVPSILLLDNFETPWEPAESRGQVEEFLSLLSDVLHLAIVVRQFICLLRACCDNCGRLQCGVRSDLQI